MLEHLETQGRSSTHGDWRSQSGILVYTISFWLRCIKQMYSNQGWNENNKYVRCIQQICSNQRWNVSSQSDFLIHLTRLKVRVLAEDWELISRKITKNGEEWQIFLWRISLFSLTTFAIFCHDKFIFKGTRLAKFELKWLKLFQWALKIELNMFQLICSQLGQFYENWNFDVQQNSVPKKNYFSKKISNFQKVIFDLIKHILWCLPTFKSVCDNIWTNKVNLD